MILRKLVKRILELDRGHLVSWSGDYDSFVALIRNIALKVEHIKKFDKVLAKEEVWIRQGIKARRTRNEGRVRALEQLRRERSQRRELQNKPKFTANLDNPSAELVIKAENVSFAFGQSQLVKNFNTIIYRGDKIALIGPNGVGKSTLLKLLGELIPQAGTIKQGSRLQIAYFDQMQQVSTLMQMPLITLHLVEIL